MSVTIDQLRTVLELEQAKGYRDLAVMGGLDRFLRNLTPTDPKLARLLSLSYSALDEGEREKWVRSVLEQLAAGVPKAQPLPQTSARGRDPPHNAPRAISPDILMPQLHRLRV